MIDTSFAGDSSYGELDDSGDLDITDLTDDTGVSRGVKVHQEAAAIMDAPTLENVKLRLAEMQVSVPTS